MIIKLFNLKSDMSENKNLTIEETFALAVQNHQKNITFITKILPLF